MGYVYSVTERYYYCPLFRENKKDPSQTKATKPALAAPKAAVTVSPSKTTLTQTHQSQSIKLPKLVPDMITAPQSKTSDILLEAEKVFDNQTTTPATIQHPTLISKLPPHLQGPHINRDNQQRYSSPPPAYNRPRGAVLETFVTRNPQ